MKEKEKQKLIDAFNRLVRQEPQPIETTFVGYHYGCKISEQDLKILRPFVRARRKKTYTIGGAEITVESYGFCSEYFIDGESYISFGRDDGDFGTAMSDLYQMINWAISAKVSKKTLYEEEQNERISQ